VRQTQQGAPRYLLSSFDEKGEQEI
jgi:hypothetical protein